MSLFEFNRSMAVLKGRAFHSINLFKCESSKFEYDAKILKNKPKIQDINHVLREALPCQNRLTFKGGNFAVCLKQHRQQMQPNTNHREVEGNRQFVLLLRL